MLSTIDTNSSDGFLENAMVYTAIPKTSNMIAITITATIAIIFFLLLVTTDQSIIYITEPKKINNTGVIFHTR